MTDEEYKSGNYVTACVSCGGRIQVTNHIRGHHACPKRHDAAQKSADTKAYDDVPTRRNQSLLTRLSTGFKMLAEKEDDE
jgi:hypothetical protein